MVLVTDVPMLDPIIMGMAVLNTVFTYEQIYTFKGKIRRQARNCKHKMIFTYVI
jgi:hypothetical protein